MNNSVQDTQHSDPSTYINDLLKDAEEQFGEQIFLDGGSEDFSEEDVADDIALNDMEQVE